MLQQWSYPPPNFFAQPKQALANTRFPPALIAANPENCPSFPPTRSWDLRRLRRMFLLSIGTGSPQFTAAAPLCPQRYLPTSRPPSTLSLESKLLLSTPIIQAEPYEIKIRYLCQGLKEVMEQDMCEEKTDRDKTTVVILPMKKKIAYGVHILMMWHYFKKI